MRPRHYSAALCSDADARTWQPVRQALTLIRNSSVSLCLPAFNAFTSATGAPAITLPLLAVDGMPVGVQLVGQWHSDWRLAATARWLMDAVEPVVSR